MTKVRLLALLAVVALVLLPAVVMAQGLSLPCAFHGSVTVNGAAVDDGTTITATIEGDEYTATVPADYGASTYRLVISPPEGTTYADGAAVTFAIGGEAAEQSSSWEGGGNIEVNLTIGGPAATPIDGIGITGASAVALPAGSDPTAEIVGGELVLGIPAGADGADGATGPAGPQGEKGDSGSGNMVIGIIAIVLAAVAIVMAVTTMRRKV